MKTRFILGLLSALYLPAQAQTVSAVHHPDWAGNASIYEANIRQHSPQGSFREFEKYLPELKKMGIGIIWVMPINPIGEKNRKGPLGSYYAVRDYKAVNPEFGSAEDFRHLVQAAHALGMKVIIDWVANHTAWDHDWVRTHPEYYLKDDKGNFVPPVADWHDVIKLDYRQPGLRHDMIDAMRFWVTDFDVNGFRCDVAEMVPTDFWNEARAALEQIRPVFMLAEGEAPDLQEKAFDMTYAWQLKDVFGDIAQGKKNANDLAAYYAGPEQRFHPNSYRMVQTSNHDLNSWEGTEYERLGDATESFLVLSALLPGMPLLYSGQEAGNHKRLEFFERDPIVWKPHPFRDLYTRLFRLKQQNHALWNGTAGGALVRIPSSADKAVYAFRREQGKDRVVAIFNLSAQPQQVSFAGNLPAGQYRSPFSQGSVSLKASQQMTLKPWEYRVFVQ